MTASLAIDHVLIGVADLAAAADRFERELGLASVEGGRHPAWGTANRIVPLGDAYLELVAVVDGAVAESTSFGRWVARTRDGRPMGWAVRTAGVDIVAARLGLAVSAGSRATPAGETLRWRSAGVDEAAANPVLPFFIEWATDASHPGATTVSHPAGRVVIAGVVLSGDEKRLADWLGLADLPVSVDRGSRGVPGVIRVTLGSSRGDVIVGSPV